MTATSSHNEIIKSSKRERPAKTKTFRQAPEVQVKLLPRYAELVSRLAGIKVIARFSAK